MKRIIKFIVVLVLILPVKSQAQKVRDHFALLNSEAPDTMMYNLLTLKPPAGFRVVRLTSAMLSTVIAPDYYTKHFGFFCKKELDVQKKTGIPLRLRLGSLDYVNKLEGK